MIPCVNAFNVDKKKNNTANGKFMNCCRTHNNRMQVCISKYMRKIKISLLK